MTRLIDLIDQKGPLSIWIDIRNVLNTKRYFDLRIPSRKSPKYDWSNYETDSVNDEWIGSQTPTTSKDSREIANRGTR